jgi:tetratricopeptide (TPR) repeat protein
MKKIILIILIIASVCNIGFCQNKFKNAAYEYFNGDLSKSITLLTDCIAAKDSLPKSYMYRGAARMFLGNYTEALKDLNISYSLDSVNKDIFLYYGKFYTATNQPQKALNYYNVAIKIDPYFAAAYSGRGIAKLMLNDFKGCVSDNSIAIKMDSNNQLFYNNRGFGKLKLRDYNGAMIDLNKSIALQPNQKAYTNIGVIHFLTNKYDQGIENFTKALKIEAKDGETLYLRGMCYKKLNRLYEACEDFAESKKLGYSAAVEELNNIKCK